MSKRLNLREFQQNLINQLQAKDLTVERVSTLGVQIASQNWLVEMEDIDEIMPLPKLAVVPFAKPWFRGVANVRGSLYGVVDMVAYQHAGVATGGVENRAIIVSGRFEFNVALLVDRVLGLRDARSWAMTELNGQHEYQDEQGATWRKLDVTGLLDQAEFLQIGV